MKPKTIFFAIFVFATSLTFSQQKIEASKIMEALKAGESISYQNKTIVGVLDFTFMEEALQKLPKRKKRSWWGNSNTDNSTQHIIDVKISFINCTFTDNVLAYIPDEDSQYTFNASFKEAVVFQNCTFQKKAMFKYSRFEKEVDFSASSFEDDTTFKYAKFDETSSFSNTTFTESSTFKYAKFRRNASFENTIFEDEAIFKYTEFKNGVSFKNANFQEDLNIKYMAVSGAFNITNMKVGYDIDSKYTKINGKSFNKYLLEN